MIHKPLIGYARGCVSEHDQMWRSNEPEVIEYSFRYYTYGFFETIKQLIKEYRDNKLINRF